MRHLCVVGLQWGDEGKGKVVDVISGAVDVVVRFQGGANAGHTVVVGDKSIVLHHLPTGVLHSQTSGVMGNGMVVDPQVLMDEIDRVGNGTRERLYLSSRAHVVLPQHFGRDKKREDAKADQKIGTTLRGIGPAYEDKFARRGVRLGDLADTEFLEKRLPEILRATCDTEEEVTRGLDLCRRLRERVGDRICDTQQVLADFDRQGKRILFEAAQGALLDIDFGTYPYVTSSSASFHGLGAGCGFSPRKVDHVLGITKAYCTRVGSGPFPSELDGAEGEALRQAGGEFGATTGRPRRCGWLDLVALRYAVEVNDVDSLALTKSDVLEGRDTVPVVVGYRLDGIEIQSLPSRSEDLERVEPVYEDWPGWTETTEAGMRPFITRLEERVGVPVSILSTGRARSEVVIFEPMAAYLEEASR